MRTVSASSEQGVHTLLSELGGYDSELGGCGSELGECDSELGGCGLELSGCGSELGEFGPELQMADPSSELSRGDPSVTPPMRFLMSDDFPACGGPIRSMLTRCICSCCWKQSVDM